VGAHAAGLPEAFLKLSITNYALALNVKRDALEGGTLQSDSPEQNLE
jgi:hypothetical protein